jgi:glycogen(starch) synthase
MRVLMFGWEFPPQITGGLGTACHGLSTALSHLVNEITFVLPRIHTGDSKAGKVRLLEASAIGNLNDPLDFEISPNIDVYSIESSLKPYLTSLEYEAQVRWIAEQRAAQGMQSVFWFSGDYGKSLFEEVIRFGQIASRAVLVKKFNIIHAHDWMTFLAGVKAKQLSGLPLIVHVHALEFDRSGDQIDQRIYDIERYGMEQANHIIAVSQRTKDLIIQKYGINHNKISVVYNGAFHDQSRTSRSQLRKHPLPGKTVVFLGRVTMQKGPEYFLEAAYMVAKKLNDVRFVMAGSGDLLPRMISRMAELRLVDRFHFTGFVTEKQRALLLSETDLFVMPSVSEPFGITPIEAIQFGVPVIVTKQSGVSEILKHAIKVDFWDVRKMADCMINILTSSDLIKQLVEGSKEDLSSISWFRAANQVHQIYQEVM